MKNKVTAHLSEQEKQLMYKNARTSGSYENIWQTVGKCVFCDLRDKYIIHEENGVALTITLYAYIDGHMLIVPRRHVRSPKELTTMEWESVRKLEYIAKKLIKKVHGIKSMQVVYKDGVNAQSTVTDHLHFHCIPFDKPNLSVWNYRDLKHTPLENAGLYRQRDKDIQKYANKFTGKYADNN